MSLRTAAAAALLAFAAGAAADDLHLSVLETPDLRLIYSSPAQDYLVPHVVRSFHNSLAWQRRVFGWTPYEKTTVLLKDTTDSGNAAARSSPNNAVAVDIAPLSRTFETFTASERVYMLMNHELVHVDTMDEWTDGDAFWRKAFGGKINPEQEHPETLLYSYLTAPRVTVPRWYLEGSAVFMETWMAGGIGRAQGAYDEMVFRAMVRDHATFHDPLGLVSVGVKQDFQVGVNAYLYGTRFISWCALTYSPEKVLEWFKRVNGSKAYYADHFKEVFGKPLDEAWQDWIAWEQGFQAANLAAVRKYPLTPLAPLTQAPLGSISRAFVDDKRGVLYSAVRQTGVLAHLGAISLKDGSIGHLVDIKGPALYKVTSLLYVPQKDLLLYTTDNNLIRDLNSYDLATGEEKRLQQDARIGDLALGANGDVYGIRQLNGLSTLVRLPPPYDGWTQVYTFPYGTDVYDIDVSPDGSLLSASVGGIDGNQKLAVFRLDDLAAGTFKPVAQQDFGTAVPEGFVFSPDGKYLFGSSYYTGVSNVFRYELKTRQLEMVTNTDTGLFRPVPLADGRLIAFSYTGAGFTPVTVDKPRPLQDAGNVKFLGAQIAAKYPVIKTWEAGSPARVDFEPLVTRRDSYIPFRELGLAAMYPLVEGYKNSVAGGALLRLADPMGFDSLQLTASYSPDSNLPESERPHVEAQYKHLGWTLHASHNDADFYDLFGPTKRSRRGNDYGIGYDYPLVYDKPRELDLKVKLDDYTNLERLPDAQNVPTLQFSELLTLKAALQYSYVLNSLGNVDDEKGVRWELAGEGDRASGDTVPRFRGGLDFGLPVGPAHSTVWLINAAGTANGDAANPFSKFYFGGFGNNYVDDGNIKRYREYYAFPGFELNQLGGRNFAKSTLEWNLPPIVFDRVGTPGFYLAWLRPAIFAGALGAGYRDTPMHAQDAGAQIDLRFQVLHRLDMTLSAGYAAGFTGGARVDDEVMVSLKIM